MRRSNDKLAVLVVGSLPPPLGGCTVTLQYLVDELRRRPDVDLRVVDTSSAHGGGVGRVARLGTVMTRLVYEARSADVVSLHVPTTAVPVWGLFVESVARAAGRPFILRKFADTDYRRLGRVRGRLAHRVVSHADVYLAETRRHVAEARARGVESARWFPTARPLRHAAFGGDAARPCRRFVYVGHLTRVKGIEQLVEAVRREADDISVDLYGPRFPDLDPKVLQRDPRVRWHGELPAGDVLETLSRYDAFVMPTVATTEGYPGSILEAYAAGLPVIASRIGGIPEIVDDASGVLVEPDDVAQLSAAMRRLASDDEAFARLRRAAADRARQFSTERWCDEFLACCRALAGPRRAPQVSGA